MILAPIPPVILPPDLTKLTKLSLLSEIKQPSIVSFFTSPPKEYKNPSPDVTKISPDLWLQVFCYLAPKDIVLARLSCKLFAGITNKESIRNLLGRFRTGLSLGLFKPALPQSQMSLLLTHLNPPQLKLEPQPLFQPGPNGFVMVKAFPLRTRQFLIQ